MINNVASIACGLFTPCGPTEAATDDTGRDAITCFHLVLALVLGVWRLIAMADTILNQSGMKSGASINGSGKTADIKRATATQLKTRPSLADTCAVLFGKGPLMPTRSVPSETVRAHAPGGSLETRPEDDMERFVRMDKERLVHRHMQEVVTLKSEIESSQAQASELRDEIRYCRTLSDRLWLTVFGLALVVTYLYVRDIGCK